MTLDSKKNIYPMITFFFLNDLQLPASCLLMLKLAAIVSFSLKALILKGIGSGRHILAITYGTDILLLDRLLLIGSCSIKDTFSFDPHCLG